MSTGITRGRLSTLSEGATASTATGTITDVKHVVVSMQENRSLDHYLDSDGSVRSHTIASRCARPNVGATTGGPSMP